MLKLPKGLIPSEGRPSLRFLGSPPKSAYKWSIVSHYIESARCRSIPSVFLWYACRVRFFASSALTNNRLNLGIIGRYQQTFAIWLMFVVASSLHSSSLTLYYDTPHMGHLCISANSFLYKMQSLGHACIFWYSIPTIHKIFFAS